MPARIWMLRLRDLAGTLAVLGTLALWPAGVSVSARADSAKALPEGPVCRSGPSQEPAILGMERWMAALAANAHRQGTSAEGDSVVTLDNAGYRYRPLGPAEPPPAAPDPSGD